MVASPDRVGGEREGEVLRARERGETRRGGQCYIGWGDEGEMWIERGLNGERDNREDGIESGAAS